MSDDVIELGGVKVDLSDAKMRFNEASLSQYIQDEGGWYNYLGQKFADFDWMQQRAELAYEQAYAKKFVEIKEGEGGSDKMVEHKCKGDDELVELKKRALIARRYVKKMDRHLKAWDKNHDNASNYGHNLRKEMDKLQAEIKLTKDALAAEEVDVIVRRSEEDA